MANKTGAPISRPTFAPRLGGEIFELLHDSMGTAVRGEFLGWRKEGKEWRKAFDKKNGGMST